MIMSVEDFRIYYPDCKKSDAQIDLIIKGLEKSIKGITCNDFSKYQDSKGNIEWPDDIKLGIVKLIQYDDEYGDKVGISSESLSRHSVSYRDLSKAETEGGYPAFMLDFLDPYYRARF